jgi:hypothetical protein
MSNDREATDRLPRLDAERLLERAAALDLAHAETLRVALLRRSAVEAGIRPESFDAALRELRDGAASDSAAPERVPFLVRATLFGVPDRNAAMVYYWLCAVTMCVAPIYVAYVMRGRSGAVVLSVALLLWLLFGLWTTSLAVRWLDDRGLRALPPRGPRRIPGA